MTNREKIRRYIERTGENFPEPYSMRVLEMLELRNMAVETPADAVILAFEYGRAKGFRYSRKKVRA